MKSPARPPFWTGAGVVAATLLFWSPALFGRFLNWDDLPVLTANPSLTLPLPELVKWAFSTMRNSAYQPAGWLLLAALRRVFGLRPEPFHAFNLLAHAAAAAAAYALAWRLLARRDAAAFSALAFSLHPMHVELLATASTPPDTLAAALVVAAVCASAYARDELSWVSAGAAAATRWLAAFAGPAVWALGGAKAARRAWPLFAVGAVSALAMAWAKSASGFSAGFSLSPVAGAAALFLTHLVFPIHLSPVYVLERAPSGRLVFAAVTAAAFAARSRRPALWRAWLFAVFSIAPTALMSEGGRHFYHDRYGYFACLAAALCVGAALRAALESRKWKTPALAAAAVVVAALGAQASRQSAFYRDSTSLWTEAALAEPGEPLVFNRLGEALADERLQPCDAKAAFETQRRLEDSPEARAMVAQADALCRGAAK